MVPSPASRARTQYFLNLPLKSIVVKQSVIQQVIAKCLTENVGGGGGGGGAEVVTTSRLYLVITNFRIKLHLLSPVVTNIFGNS